MLKVNAYTTGVNAPSARYRVRQVIPFLDNIGVSVDEIISKTGAFPPKTVKIKQLKWAVCNILENGIKILKQPEADVTWLQKVMLSKHYTFERFLKKPMVFDVDDAIFLGNNGVFAQKIAKQSERIICGNNFLANYFEKFNSNIDIIPTSIDVSKYDEISKKQTDVFYILWSGTSSGFPFLYNIERSLKVVVDKYDFVKIKIISDSPPIFKYLTEDDYTFDYWNTEIEFSSMKNADVGIMPLLDSDQARGKCSYKMLCYMAARLPVVVSPVGMNNDVLNLGNIGFGAKTEQEWVDALSMLVDSARLRDELSANAYQIVSDNFDVRLIARSLNSTFTKTIR